MIDNKIVTIIKKNEFNKGWALFKPVIISFIKNYDYKELTLNNIKNAITYANEVKIFLKENCLSNQIIREIEWVKRNYSLNLELIVSDKNLFAPFININIDKSKIEPSIKYNVVKIKGKINKSVLIADKIYQIHESFDEKNLFEKKLENYKFLKNIKILYLVENRNDDVGKILKYAKTNNIEVNYLVSSKDYSKKHFDFAKNNQMNLLVSNYVSNLSFFVDNYNRIYSMTPLENGNYIPFAVKDSFPFFDTLYQSCFFKNKLESKKLTNNFYTIHKGKIEKLNIIETHTIHKTMNIELMEDFINENFDRSICEKHNDYSNISQNVKYVFTLIPPIIDGTYVESQIYSRIHKLSKVLKSIQELNIKQIKEDYRDVLLKDYGIIYLLDESQKFIINLSKMEEKIDYSEFYNGINNILEIFNNSKNDLKKMFNSMFLEIHYEKNQKVSDKFDAKINQYQQIIDEKEEDIKNNVNVLANKRTIKILKENISKEIALRDKFISNFDDSAQKNDFLIFYDNVLNKNINEKSDSIENIVNINEKSKESKFKFFVSKYLNPISEYIDKSIKILNQLKLEKIPTTHAVFEKNNQRYIVIKTKEEFEQTKKICKEFNLLCLTKR